MGGPEGDAFPIGWRRQLLYEHSYLSVAVLLKSYSFLSGSYHCSVSKPRTYGFSTICQAHRL